MSMYSDYKCGVWDMIEQFTEEELKAEAKKLGYVVAKKPIYQCSCYMPYPNECHRQKNGNWKCIDRYKNIRPLETIDLGLPFPKYVRKTKCERIEESEVGNDKRRSDKSI